MAQSILVFGLRIYRSALSPVLTSLFGATGLGCRYTPTCSQYALDAVRAYGAWRGSWMTLRRLSRCHPWGGCGSDPVPLRHPDPRASSLN